MTHLPNPTRQSNTQGAEAAYVDSAVRGVIAKLAAAANGDRNDELFRSSTRIYQFVEAGALSESEANDLLWREASALGLTKMEITSTLRSARRSASGHPATIPAPAARPATTAAAKGWTGLDDYADDHAIAPDVLRAAGWNETTHRDRTSGKMRPALQFCTPTGMRWRYLDGQEPKYDSPNGYHRSWYRLKEAVEIAESTGQPLVICNGEASALAGQSHGVAAVAIAGGSEKPTIPPDLLSQLRAVWSGPILVPFDCDTTGRKAAPQVAEQLRATGYIARAVDLGGTNGFDLADLCRLHEGGSAEALAALPELRESMRPAAEHDGRWQFLRGAEIDTLAPPRWLVRGYLVLGAVTLVVGPSESGKTALLIDMAQRVAAHYPVIYTAAEDASGVRVRMRAWELHHTQPRSENFILLPDVLQLADPMQVDSFIAAARPFGARLVVIDTLSQCILGAEENDNTAMAAVVLQLTRIAQELDAAVVVLHHPTKAGDTYRGASALMNNTGALIEVEKGGDDVIRLRVTRNKQGGLRDDRFFRLVERATDIKDDRDELMTSVVALPAARVLRLGSDMSARERDLLQLIADATDADDGISTTSAIDRSGSKQATCYTMLKFLREHGYITKGTGKRGALTITNEGRAALRDAHRIADASTDSDPTGWDINDRLPPPSTGAEFLGVCGVLPSDKDTPDPENFDKTPETPAATTPHQEAEDGTKLQKLQQNSKETLEQFPVRNKTIFTPDSLGSGVKIVLEGAKNRVEESNDTEPPDLPQSSMPLGVPTSHEQHAAAGISLALRRGDFDQARRYLSQIRDSIVRARLADQIDLEEAKHAATMATTAVHAEGDEHGTRICP
jgi:KaiC/GvpD/RAD55 family RecA-like ATPase